MPEDPLVRRLVRAAEDSEGATALARWRAVLAVRPGHPAAILATALACADAALTGPRGDAQAALSGLDAAGRVFPRDHRVWAARARVLARLGDLPQAAVAWSEAAERVPEDASVHNELGRTLRAMGRPQLARRCFERAISLQPALVSALNNLAVLHQDDGRHDQALPLLRRAAGARPDLAALAYNLAMAELGAGFDEAGRETLDALLTTASASPRLRFSRACALPIVHRDAAHRAWARGDWAAQLDALTELASQNLAGHADAWWDAVQPAFARHYAGGPLHPDQSRFGALLARIGVAAMPDLPLPAVAPGPDRRLRVVFVSAHVRNHTITKLFGAWMTGLPAARFDVTVVHMGTRTDGVTARIRAGVDRFIHLPGGARAAAPIVAGLRPDVVVFPELGMDAEVLKLGALRIARVQCVGWGHPVTTGLPTIDLFLSADAMEPPHADDAYSEALVRLPGIGVQPTLPAHPPRRERGALGLPCGRPIALCAQSLFKCRPADDAGLARLCASHPSLLMLFIAHPAAAVTERFLHRISAAFVRAGADPATQLRVLPRLDERAFLGLHQVVDFAVDTGGWSGGNTCLEALACGLPVLARPGDTMRSRHSAAILRAVSAGELVATDLDGWLAVAGRLVQDAAWRRRLGERAQRGVAALSADTSPVLALADVLEGAART